MTILTVFSRKDLVTLFDIRDNAFHLLVQKLGEQTPLIYASRRSFSSDPSPLADLTNSLQV